MKKILSLIFLFGTLFSCGQIETSNYISSSEDSTYIAKSLSEAIQNTQENYQMDIITDLNFSYIYQVISPNLYYYSPGSENYILLDEDPNYYHSYEKTKLNTENIFKFGMDVHGRAGKIENKNELYSVDFLDILKKYMDDFSKTNENTYMCTVKDLAYDLKNYFQNRSFTYCNYFEIELGTDGRLGYFRSYEKSLNEMVLVGQVSFKLFNINTFEAYKLWDNDGRKINLRLVDLKLGSQKGLTYHLFYENEICEVEGIVAGFDFNNNIIIATENDLTGYLGLQVTLKDSTNLPSINEKIKVKGTVKQENYSGKLVDATYTSLGQEDYHPFFDEERIVDIYGGGYYAAYFFSQTPIYADSIYSTYAYVESLPTSLEENKETFINLICPTFKSEENMIYHMQLILPNNMSLEQKEKIINELKQFGTYNSNNNVAQEISFEHFIIRFNPSYTYRIQLEYGLESSISKHLSPNEKIEKQFNLKNFPFPNTNSFSCFKFGGSSRVYIEANYGKEGKTPGIYYNASSLSNEAIKTELHNLELYGFILFNEIKDDYNQRHQIYKMNDTYVDILIEEISFVEEEKSFSMWIYQGKMIYKDKVQEKIANNIPYFNVDDFVTLDQIKDADMTFYQLPNYAGNTFEQGNYLNCITIDVNEECFTTIRSNYINDKGFKTARDENNKIYTYNTRGSNHYVLYKEIEGSDEKIYVDMAMYSTSDYTFVGHNEFTNRIEILIYKSTKPLETKYESNLNTFTNYLETLNPDSGFEVNFSKDIKVESWLEINDNIKYNYIYYGYLFEYNAFIYSTDLNQTYSDLIDGLVSSGYVYGTTTQKGNVTYYKNLNNGNTSFIFIMKETDKGYIRLINGAGGIDF